MSDFYTVEDLSVHFQKGQLKAVDHVSFSIPTGSIVGLVGESGSGKTTTARALAGIGPVTGGTIKFKGQKLADVDRHQFRRAVQMVFQDPFESLNPREKVGDIIAEGIVNFHLAKSAAGRRQRVLSLLQAVGLSANAINRFPHEFSGGQRQRIGIARALAVEPEFLFLDEPISALDVSIQAQIVNLLKRLQQERNLTYLFIAHDLSMVAYLCDTVLVMYHGRIVESGPTKLVYGNPQHAYTQSLLSAVPHADPLREAQKSIITFDSSTIGPNDQLVEVEPKHFVLK
jgi:oligopeptide transport system ATP-binding protein